MSQDTIFQRLIKRELPVFPVYEDDKNFAFLDITPYEKGHTLVVPKKPYKKISDMPENEYLELQKVVLRLVKHYEEIFNTRMATLTYGLEVPHVHIHIIPITNDIEVFDFKRTKRYLDNEKENYMRRLKLE